MCGFTEIDGYAFCLGVDSMEELYQAPVDLQGLIRSVTYLIRGAIFRPNYTISKFGRVSLDICSLGELIDMYHSHEATKLHDKVYALLGMCSDDLSRAGLLPNYKVPWEEILQRLAKHLLCEKISVETWADKEMAVIKSKGRILGKVSSVQNNITSDGRQEVDVIFMNIAEQPGYMGKWGACWTLQPSAKPVREGDLICLLQGVSKPTIIRLHEDQFFIIVINAVHSESKLKKVGYLTWSRLFQLEGVFTRDFLLLWDWESPLKELQDLKEYETLIQTDNEVLESPETELEGHLERATRTWNMSLILGDSQDYEKAGEKLQEAIEGYRMAFGIKDPCTLNNEYGLTPLSWAAGNGYNDIVSLLLAKDGVDLDLKDSQYGWTPLLWAADRDHKVTVKLLLQTGKVEVDAKDDDGYTPLWRAADRGHEAVVKLLLETGKVEVDAKDKQGCTLLWRAANRGNEAVVKLLLETGKAEVDAKDNDGYTPLWRAADRGHGAVVRLLQSSKKSYIG